MKTRRRSRNTARRPRVPSAAAMKMFYRELEDLISRADPTARSVFKWICEMAPRATSGDEAELEKILEGARELFLKTPTARPLILGWLRLMNRTYGI